MEDGNNDAKCIYELSMSNKTSSNINGFLHNQTNYTAMLESGDDAMSEEDTIFLLFVLGIIFVSIGCTGNFITIFVVIHRKLYKRVTYLVICLLAFPDMTAVLLRGGYLLFLKEAPSYEPGAGIFLSAIFVTICSSNCHIIILARLRYKLIVNPLLNLTYTSRSILKQSFLAWTFSVILGIPYFLTFRIPDSVPLYKYISLTDVIVAFPLFLSVSIPVLTFHCLKIRHLKKGLTCQKNVASRMSVVVTVILLIHVITIGSIPMGVIFSMLNIGGIALVPIVQFTLMFNHSINPVIYFLSNCCRNHSESVYTSRTQSKRHLRQTNSV